MNSSSEGESHESGGECTAESSLVRLPLQPPSSSSPLEEDSKCGPTCRPLAASTPPPRLLGSRSSNCSSSSPSSPLMERKPWPPAASAMVLPPAALLPLPTLNFSVSQVPPVNGLFFNLPPPPQKKATIYSFFNHKVRVFCSNFVC